MAKVSINIKFVDIDHTKIDKYIVNDEITFAPVINAEWKMEHWLGERMIFDKMFRCSNCNKLHKVITKYCPNCGAKMDQR